MSTAQVICPSGAATPAEVLRVKIIRARNEAERLRRSLMWSPPRFVSGREFSRSELWWLAAHSVPLRVLLQKVVALVEHGYWMTWSARTSTDCGIVSARAFAALRFT